MKTGEWSALKPDGTAFHHNGHYPAYAVGAFNTLNIAIRGDRQAFEK